MIHLLRLVFMRLFEREACGFIRPRFRRECSHQFFRSAHILRRFERKRITLFLTFVRRNYGQSSFQRRIGAVIEGFYLAMAVAKCELRPG